MSETPNVYWSAIGPPPSPPVYVILGPTVTPQSQYTPDPDETLRRAVLSMANGGADYVPASLEAMNEFFRIACGSNREGLYFVGTNGVVDLAANDYAKPHTEAEVTANMRAWLDRMQAIAESVGVDVRFSVGRLGKQPEQPQ